MCLAINSTKGTTPKRDEMLIGFENNPDGIGYCFAKDGKLIKKDLRKKTLQFEIFSLNLFLSCEK